MKRIRLVGVAVSGRVFGGKNLRQLETLAELLKQQGIGLASACQTQGDRHLVRVATRLGVYTAGFFSNTMGAEEFKGIVHEAFVEYEPWIFTLVSNLYRSKGKSWEFLSSEQQRMFVRYGKMAQLVYGGAIWEGDQAGNIFSHMCRIFQKPVMFLNHAESATDFASLLIQTRQAGPEGIHG